MIELKSEEDCNVLVNFLKQVNIQVLPFDEILEGIHGFVAFPVINSEAPEPEIAFGWRFAEPIKDNKESVDPDVLIKCVTESGWIPAHDPVKREFGFINQDRSKRIYFRLVTIKTFSQEVKDKFNEWHKVHQ